MLFCESMSPAILKINDYSYSLAEFIFQCFDAHASAIIREWLDGGTCMSIVTLENSNNLKVWLGNNYQF